LIGWQDNPTPLYGTADVVLHPTLWEGLPVALIEAQAAGLPIVASNIKGNREVVAPETGYLCEPKNAAAYAEALARLIKDRMLRTRMGNAAKARAAKHFDSSVNSLKIVELYDELLGAAPAATQPVRAA
jgi:glycosyltransferase involved in cell wall biosynthesis